MNCRQVEAGTGWAGERREVEGERVDVEPGLKGVVVEGVRRELRCVEMVSSRVERERRRKEERASGWKQKVGVRRGGGGGVVMLRGEEVRLWRREGRGGGGGDEGGGSEDAQNSDASVSCELLFLFGHLRGQGRVRNTV